MPWPLLAAGLPGSIASFFFKLFLFPVLSLGVGIGITVWGAGRIRRGGRRPGGFLAVLACTHLLLLPALTAAGFRSAARVSLLLMAIVNFVADALAVGVTLGMSRSGIAPPSRFAGRA